MRCHKVTLVLCLSALWLAGPVGVALSVSLPFYDDFENVGVGSYPSAKGWRTWSAGYTRPRRRSGLLQPHALLPAAVQELPVAV